MSFMQKIFGPAATPAAPPAPPGITNNLNTNEAPLSPSSSEQTAPNGVVPPNAAEGPIKQSPDDKFATLWEPVKQDESKNPSAESGLSPEKMMEAAGKVDFTKVLDQESLKKISAGGEEAVQALAQLLNKTAQTVYGQSTVVAQKLVETAVNKAKMEFANQVPSMVKKQQMRDGLHSQSAAFKDPSVAPVISAVQSMLEQKFPSATATELNDMAKEWMVSAAGKFNPAKPESKTSSREEDWDAYAMGKT